ncbi:MAG: right-handed parallel beta-helix repeat-containing protein, partial [Candidatus Diapherotrites archaeon]|nr:right-handed parallel beta-helix repeat-containing protein [Candidatus Diapherotrites archaeon]
MQLSKALATALTLIAIATAGYLASTGFWQDQKPTGQYTISLAGNIYYVAIENPSCSDSGPGSSSQPWCTLDRAYTWYSGEGAKVQEGDTVLFRNGNYGEFKESTADNPGEKWLFYRNDWITYKAESGQNPVLEKVYIRNEDKWGEIEHGRSYLIIDGFEITNSAYVYASKYVQIKNCKITNEYYYPYNGLYAPYYYPNAKVVTVRSSSQHVTLENNDISGNFRGADISSTTSDIVVRGNTIHHVGEDTISIGGNNVLLENNFFYDIDKHRTTVGIKGTQTGSFQVGETIFQESTLAEGIVISNPSSGSISAIQTNDKEFWEKSRDGGTITGQTSKATLTDIHYRDYAHTDAIQIHANIHDIIVRGNTIKREEGGQGLKMVGPDNVTVENNLIWTSVPLFWGGSEGGVIFRNNTLVVPVGSGWTGNSSVGYESKESNNMLEMYNNIINYWGMAADRHDLGDEPVYTRVLEHGSNIFGNDPNGSGGELYPFYVDYETELVNYGIDSLFVDPAGFDYRVRMDSPACDGSVNGQPEVAVGALPCVCLDSGDCIFGGSCVSGECVGTKSCFGTNESCGTFPNCSNCNWKDACYGTEYRDYSCSGASCTYSSQDCSGCSCSCGGYGETESTEKGNCADGKDNDCDGRKDSTDKGCQAPSGVVDGYVAYYRFEGTIKDYAGKHTGQWLGKNEEVYSERAADNYALELDGVDDYIELVNHEDFDMSSALTISAWVKPMGVGTDTIFTKGAVDSSAIYTHYGLWASGTGPVKFVLELSSDSATGDVSTSQIFETGEWHHLVGRFDGTTGSIFVNGEKVASKETGFSTISIPTASYDRMRIGGEQVTNNKATDFFEGAIDEVIIYNKALSDAEIGAIYRGQNICGHGKIISTCYCEGTERTTGYCCNGTYQAGVCSDCLDTPALMEQVSRWKHGNVGMY